MAKLSPLFNDQTFIPGTSTPASGYKLFTYTAGSSTKQTTYTDAAGTVQQSNPIILNSSGWPTMGPIWQAAGSTIKFVLAPPTDTDPPTSPVKTVDSIPGINDTSSTVTQWAASLVTPTYISATSFSLVGDQTTEFHVGRRLQFTTTAGTVYGTILTSAFTTLTTVTMTMDSGQVLDVGLSAINLSILRNDHLATPSSMGTTTMIGAINEARATVAGNATTSDIWGATSANSINLTGVITYTNFPAAPQAGAKRRLFPATGAVFTNAGAFGIVGNANYTVPAGGSVDIEAITTTTFRLVPLNADGTPVAAWLQSAIRSQLAGLTLSTAGSSATMSIAAGGATDTTNAQFMALAAAIAKTTSAWALGNAVGGLDTGAIAINTWYHFYLIKRVDTGVVDVVLSLSASAPTLPANYTLYRRIGSGLTNGSSQWTAFIQDGDLFQWLTHVSDISANNPGIAAVTRTLTVPTGVNVIAKVQATINNNDTAAATYSKFTDLATTDVTPSGAVSDTSGAASVGGNVTLASTRLDIRTNTSAQIRSRVSFSNANVAMTINTLGWTDRRGRDA